MDSSLGAWNSQSLNGLKRQARNSKTDDEKRKSIKETSQQFEAVFLNTMMKQARAAKMTEDEGLFSSEATKTFQSLHDTEIANAMSKKGVGLGAIIEKQLLMKEKLLQDQKKPNEIGK